MYSFNRCLDCCVP